MMTSARSTFQSVRAADAGRAGIGGIWFGLMPALFSDFTTHAEYCRQLNCPRDPNVAFAPFPRREPTAYRDGWLPE